MANQPHPIPNVSIEPFYGKKDESVKDWLRRFDQLCAAMNYNEDRKLAVLKVFLRGAADLVARSFTDTREADRTRAQAEHAAHAAAVAALAVGAAQPAAPAAVPDPVTFQELRDHLIRVLSGPQSERLVQREFNRRRQAAGETVTDFGLELLDLAKRSFPRLPLQDQEGAALQRFIEGVHERFRSQLILREYDTLLDAIKDAELLQSVEDDKRVQRSAEVHVLGDQAATSTGALDMKQIQAQLSEIQNRMIETPGTSQTRQGGGPRPRPADECFNCGKQGHYSRECRGPRRQYQDNRSYDSRQRQPRRDREPMTSSLSELRCHECGGVGHFANQCANRRSQQGNGGGPSAGPRLTGGNAQNRNDRNRRDNRRYDGGRDRGRDSGQDRGRDTRDNRQGRTEDRPGPRERQPQRYNTANTLSNQGTTNDPPPLVTQPAPEGPNISGPTGTFPPTPKPTIPSGGAWGVRQGDTVTFKLPEMRHNQVSAVWPAEKPEQGTGEEATTATRKDRSRKEKNRKKLEKKRRRRLESSPLPNPRFRSLPVGLSFPILVILGLGLLLLTPVKANLLPDKPTNPLLCESAKGGLSWFVPSEYECSVSDESSHKPPETQPLLVYRENIWAYKTEGYICTKIRHTFKQKVWFFRDNREVNETIEKVRVNQEECHKWVKTKQTEWGALEQSAQFPGVWAVSQPIDRAYGTFMFGCCRWKTQIAHGASIHKATISKRHGDDFPISAVADLTGCRYEAGFCPLHNGQFAYWTVNASQACPISPWKTLKGTRANNLWISSDENWAFSFHKEKAKKVICGEIITTTDQGVKVREGERREMPAFAMEGGRTKPRQTVRSKRKAPTVGIVTEAALAARLQAVAAYTDRALKQGFLLNAKAICALAKATFANMKAQLATNPTALVRQLVGGKPVKATYSGGIIQIYHCAELPEGSFVFPPSTPCFDRYVHIVYTVAGQNHTGYMDTVTNEIQSRVEKTTCYPGRPSFISLKQQSFWLFPNGHRAVSNVSSFPKFPAILQPFNLSLSYDHTTFTDYLLYDMEAFQPAIGIGSLIHVQAEESEISHLIHLQGERDEDKAAISSLDQGLFGWLYLGTPSFSQLLLFGIILIASCCLGSFCCCPSLLSSFMGAPHYIKQAWQKGKPQAAPNKEPSTRVLIQIGNQVSVPVENKEAKEVKSFTAIQLEEQEEDNEYEEMEPMMNKGTPQSPLSSLIPATQPYSARRGRIGTHMPLTPSVNITTQENPGGRPLRLPFLEVVINNQRLAFILDTGSNISLALQRTANRLLPFYPREERRRNPGAFLRPRSINPPDPYSSRVMTGGGAIPLLGSLPVVMRLPHQITALAELHITPDVNIPFDGILGTDVLAQLGEVTVNMHQNLIRINGLTTPFARPWTPNPMGGNRYPGPGQRRRDPTPRPPGRWRPNLEGPGRVTWDPEADELMRQLARIPGNHRRTFPRRRSHAGRSPRGPRDPHLPRTPSDSPPPAPRLRENQSGPSRAHRERRPERAHPREPPSQGVPTPPSSSQERGKESQKSRKKKASAPTCEPPRPDLPRDPPEGPGGSGGTVSGKGNRTKTPVLKEMGPSNSEAQLLPNYCFQTLTIKGVDLPLVDVELNGKSFPFLFDTGASVSITPFSTFQQLGIPPEKAWPVMEQVHALSGVVLGTHRFKTNVKLGTTPLGEHEFLVVHNSACAFQGILGNDISKEAGELALNMKERYLKINSLTMPISVVNCIGGRPPPLAVRCHENTTIPPRTGKAVMVRLDPGPCRQSLNDWEDRICEPNWPPLSKQGLLMPRSLVNASNLPFCLVFENPSHSPAKLYANQTLAWAEKPTVAIQPMKDGEDTAPHVRLGPEDMKEINTLAPAKPLSREELLDLFDWADVDLTNNQLGKLQNLLWEYRSAFARDSYDLGRCGIIKLEIDTGDNPPVRIRPNRIPEALKEEVKEQLTKMEERGIIRPSCSPWSSNMVLVRKPDGSLRCCIDWRRVNALTRRDSYPLPLITTLLDSLGKAKVMSTLDLAAGFWQLELSEEAKCKTAFNTMWGLYEFNVAGFGLMNLPSQFQRVMDHVLTGLQHEVVLVYLDDLLVFSESFERHLEDLGKVLNRLQQFNLKAKPSKVYLCRKEVKFLGHRVSKEGLQPDDSKIVAIRELESPSDLKSLQAAIGMLNFYRKFILGYSTLIAPMYTLLRKGEAFKWTPQHEAAFRSLTKKLTEAPILALPDFSKTFTLTTDASNYALGAILSQDHDGYQRPVSYLSRVLLKAEKNYSITEKECLAAVWAIDYFKEYLVGRDFILITDHSPLKTILTTSTDSPRLQRWALKLQQYSYTVKYKKGPSNTADGLSRLAKGSLSINTIPKQNPETRAGSQEKKVRFETTEREQETQEGYLLVDPCLRNAQRKDPWLLTVIAYLESGELPEDTEEADKTRKAASLYELGPANCLYAKEPNPGARHRPLVVPTELVPIVLSEHHDGLGGHLGIARTLFRLRQSYVWPGMYRDTLKFVEECMTCQRTKSPLYKPRSPMVPWMPAEPWQRLYMDVLGPLTLTERGSKYILCFQDAATAWPEAFAVPDTKSSRIAEIMFTEIYCRFGAPSVLCSDQGRNLLAQVVNDLNSLFKVRRLTTAGYRPETMGQIEVGNRVMGSMLRAFCLERPQDWDLYLPAALLALRTSVQASRGESPAFLTFGRDLPYPIEAMRNPRPKGYREVEDFRADLVLSLNDANRLARQHLVQAQSRNKQNYDKKVRGTDFVVGQRVWLEMPRTAAPKGSSRKLWIQRKGPFRIVDLSSYPNAEIIPCDKPRSKPKTVHVARLRPCYDPHVITHEISSEEETETETEKRSAIELMFPPTWTIQGLPEGHWPDNHNQPPPPPQVLPAPPPPPDEEEDEPQPGPLRAARPLQQAPQQHQQQEQGPRNPEGEEEEGAANREEEGTPVLQPVPVGVRWRQWRESGERQRESEDEDQDSPQFQTPPSPQDPPPARRTTRAMRNRRSPTPSPPPHRPLREKRCQDYKKYF